MGKAESTAINNLIHVAQGRVLQRTAPSGVRGAPAPISTLARPALPPPLPNAAAGSNTALLSDSRIQEMPLWGAEDAEDEMTVRVDPEMRAQMLAAALQKEQALEAARKAEAAQRAAVAYAAPAYNYAPQHALPNPHAPHPYYQQQPAQSPAYAFNAGMHDAYGVPYAAPSARHLSIAQRLQLVMARHTVAIGAAAIVLAVAVTYVAFGGSPARGTATTAQATVAPSPAVAALAAPTPAPTAVKAAPAPTATPIEPVIEPIVEPPAAVVAAAPAAEAPAPAPIEVAAVAPVETDEVEAPAPAKKVIKKSSRSRQRSARIAREREVARAERRPSRSKRAESDPVLAAIHGESKSTKKSASGSGRVLIKANVDATVYVDGRRTATTVPGALTLAAGKHQVTLLDPETKKAKTSEFDLEAGETIKINRTF